MKIYLASDHAGYDLKQIVIRYIKDKGYKFEDLGTFSKESVNWAEYGAKAAKKVSEDPINTKGIIICGSGMGMSMVSNKFKNVRAALCNDLYSAEMSRKHNDANVLNMGGRVVGRDLALKIVEKWLNTEYEGGRHQKRIDYLTNEIEKINFK